MNLGEKFSKELFIDWISEIIPDFKRDVKKVDVPKSFSGVSKMETFGESSIGVRVFAFEMDSDPIKKRVTITKDSFNVLKMYSVQNAIIAYYSPDYGQWRLSLLTSSAVWEDGKIVSKISNLKRQSFVLGEKSKVKTPTKYLAGNVADLNDLKKRFSIEVVNKDFYKEISKAFNDLQKVLHLPSNTEKSQTNLEFSVRLIGRIIFCWFLREKKSDNGLSLISNKLLSLDAIKENPDYYHKVLEPLFFEILNKPIESRRPDEFNKEPYSQTPYLNGGLFSAQYDDFYERGRNDFQSKFHNNLKISDSWFESLFEVLETYNFTIDENTSFDEELSIDPEMLGRIFENLLAEINPETGESARKSTGSYYTPRVIVDYMVDESLFLYLKNKTEISEEKLRSLISYDLDDDESNPVTQDEKIKIIDALGAVKILDPACGSGAFPMGALQKIVFILQQIDPKAEVMYEADLKRTPPEYRKHIQEEYNAGNFDYLRKLRVIRESIYGVDIQPIATEISRLRCFLTLVVDQQIRDEREDRGIKPLPNLDFKFVTANTLIGLPKNDDGAQQLGFYDDREKIEDLKNTIDEYFNSSGIEREQLKTQFANKQKQLLREMEKEHGWSNVRKAELSNKLVDWEPFEHKPADWFDPEWMFGIKGGFDIVMANPPYDVYQGKKKDEIDPIKKLDIYEISKGGKLNMYKLFLARSSQLQKNNSILCEIFQNSFLGDNSAKLLRKHFFETQQIIQLDSYPERDNHKKRVFEAVKMSVCILISIKQQLDDYNFSLNVWRSKDMDSGFKTKYLKSEILKIDPIGYQIPLLEEKEKVLFSKVFNHPHAPIKCIEGELNMTFHKKYFNSNNKNPKIIKGAAVQRYYLTDKLSQGEVEYLDFDKYIKDFGSSQKSQHYKLARVAMQGITGVDDKRRLIMAYLPAGYFCANSCNYIISNDSNYSLSYLLAIFNSKLINWIFKKTSTNSNVNCYEIENLPVPEINNKNGMVVSEIKKTVEDLLKTDDGLIHYEELIDKLVYKLYGLTKEEINVVEESIK